MRIVIDGLSAHSPTWRRGIGRVFHRLLAELLFHERQSEVVVTCFDDGLRASLSANTGNVVFRRLDREIMTRPPPERAIAYSAEIAALAADGETVFWHPNPLMLDQILPYHITQPALLTIYDFIPLRHKQLYFDRWPASARAEYMRRIDFLRQPNVAACPISETIAKQARDLLPTATRSTRAVVIGYDADRFTFNPIVAHQPGRDDPYVIMVSGDDPRKNIAGFVEAFCRWRELGNDAALKVVCQMGDQTRQAVARIAADHGCDHHVEVLGYVSDQALASLTQRAALAAMPSLDEGFGLPVVEAMACGVPVISSDIAAAREIGGDLLDYFDPSDTGSIVAALSASMSAVAAGRIDRERLVARAREFTWARSGVAFRTRLAAFAEEQNRGSAGHPDADPRWKVAMLTPWPPHRTGVAISAEALAGALAPRVDLTVVAECTSDPQPSGSTQFVTPQSFRAEEYDVLICQMGNNSNYHTWIYNHALSPKALVIAHDAFIHPFLQRGHGNGTLVDEYRAMLRNHMDDDAIAAFESDEFREVEVLGYTGFSEISKRAGAILFHSNYARDLLLREGSAVAGATAVAPLAYRPTEGLGRTEPPRRPDRFVLGMFGHMTRFKQPVQVLGALQLLVAIGVPVEMRVVGHLGDLEAEMLDAIDRLALADHVRLIGFADEEEFIAHIACCDVVVNLRHPTLGESSAVVCEAMHLGVPVVVSNGGSFVDLPDDAVVKVSAQSDVQNELATRVLELLTDPQRRARIGDKARLYARNAASIDRYADTVAKLVAAIGREARAGRIVGTR